MPGDMPGEMLPNGESPFVIGTQFGENACCCCCPAVQDVTTCPDPGDESVGTTLIDECTSSSGRAFLRFLFALLLLLFPVALGLGLDPGVLLPVAFGRAAWNCCTMAAALPLGISTAGGDVARGDAMLTMGDFCPSGGEVGAGTALGELQPSDQSVSNSTMS